eukprot:2421369-Pyramimonas_sp.AAC.1
MGLRPLEDGADPDVLGERWWFICLSHRSTMHVAEASFSECVPESESDQATAPALGFVSIDVPLRHG